MFPEYREIIAQLKHLAAKGEPLPIVSKLVDMKETAAVPSVSLADFKKQEHLLPSKRKMVGHAARYRNTDIVKLQRGLCYMIDAANNTSPTKRQSNLRCR